MQATGGVWEDWRPTVEPVDQKLFCVQSLHTSELLLPCPCIPPFMLTALPTPRGVFGACGRPKAGSGRVGRAGRRQQRREADIEDDYYTDSDDNEVCIRSFYCSWGLIWVCLAAKSLR